MVLEHIIIAFMVAAIVVGTTHALLLLHARGQLHLAHTQSCTCSFPGTLQLLCGPCRKAAKAAANHRLVLGSHLMPAMHCYFIQPNALLAPL